MKFKIHCIHLICISALVLIGCLEVSVPSAESLSKFLKELAEEYNAAVGKFETAADEADDAAESLSTEARKAGAKLSEIKPLAEASLTKAGATVEAAKRVVQTELLLDKKLGTGSSITTFVGPSSQASVLEAVTKIQSIANTVAMKIRKELKKILMATLVVM